MSPVRSRSPRPRLLAGISLLIWASSGLASGAGPAPQALRLGVSVAGDFRGGPVHSYAVDLAAGELARVGVTMVGVWVRIVVTSPAGREILRCNSLSNRYGTLAVSVVAEEGGHYLFAVSPQPGGEPAGSYRIELAARRPAGPDDRLRTGTERTLAAAGELLVQGGPADLARAVALGESTLAAWRSLGDRTGEADAHYLVGLGQLLANRHAEAARSLGRAESIWRGVGDRFGLAKVLHQIGRARRYLGDTRGALAAFAESAALSRATGQACSEALTLYAEARLEDDTGDLPAALADYGTALAIFKAQDDRLGEALVLDALGGIRQRQGRAANALDAFTRALALARGLDNANLEAEALDHLGALRARLGQLYPAVDAFAEAVERYRAAGNPASEGLARADLGELLVDLGEADEGGRLLDDAVGLLRDPRDQARVRLLLARLAGQRGDAAGALALAGEALSASRAMEHPEGEAKALSVLGFLHLGRGEPAAARDELGRSLALAERVGSLAAQAEALRGLGQAAAALGDLAASDGSFGRALPIARQLKDTGAETCILEEMARARRARGDLDGAREAIESALAGIESLHARVAGDHLRVSHLAAQREAYEIEVDVLERLDRARPAAGLAARAFETAERARARGMLDFLMQARVDLREGNPELAREEERLRLELNARSARRAELLAEPGKAAEAAALDSQIAGLAASYEIAEARLAASSPGYAGLGQPEVRLAELQREVLDGDTVLLEYFLAEPRSYLWEVTSGSLRSFELPGRERIEALARRVHEEMGQPGAGDGAAARRDAEELSRLLLAPVAAELGGRRVAVVPDGALLYVPFAALPVPASGAAGERGGAAEPLVVGHEVVHLPSAAVVRELRRGRESRPRAPATLALLADPVFGRDDPRVRAGRMPATAASRPSGAASPAAVLPAASGPQPTGQRPDTLPAARKAAGGSFVRLPWTRREAEVIAAAAHGRDVLVALDFAANRTLATGGSLARFRLVHFATHGVLDTRRPELSGLVLSQVDEQGGARDGFLRLDDVYHLELDADLVVLSGCETALGETLRGEGIVGLTRGFFHAGASQVLASLWPVRDRATAELMQRFYRAMLHDRLPPAAALRQAQAALRQEQPWREPYFWAGFVLEGDWQVPAP